MSNNIFTMQEKIRPLSVFIWVMILISCCNSKEANKNNKGTTNTSEVDTIRGYYPGDSVLKYEIPLKDGYINGDSKSFYPNGRIKGVKKYLGGKKLGYTKFYYPDGTLKEKVFYVNDQPFGHAYYYYDNGVLETYASFDFQAHNRYLRKYDKEGNIIRDEGKPLGQLKKEFSEKDSLKLMFCYARPPKTKIEVIAKIYYSEGVVKDKKINLKKRIGKLSFRDSSIIDKVIFVGELRDSLTNRLIGQDSLFYPPTQNPRQKHK